MSQLLTPAELADYLQVTEATLADFRYRSRGPRFVKVGRLVRYKREDVDDWLASNASPGDPRLRTTTLRVVGGGNAKR